jgi:hypothetical protein
MRAAQHIRDARVSTCVCVCVCACVCVKDCSASKMTVTESFSPSTSLLHAVVHRTTLPKPKLWFPLLMVFLFITR